MATDQPKPNWKDHPVVVAALAASGSILLTITIYSGVVIPTMVKDKELQIADLNKRLESLEKASKERDDRLAAMSSELGQLKLRDSVLSRQDIFSSEDVYPKG